MDRRQEIISEINRIKQSDLDEKEKTDQIIKLARELGEIILEKKFEK
ncbi:MAG: hypothetical protein ACOY4I_06220 [Bacillota bacterium]